MPVRKQLLTIFSVVCVALLVFSAVAEAARPQAGRVQPRVGVNDPRYAALVMDAETGEVLHEQNASTKRYPASLTKMMTLYLLFEHLDAGKATLATKMPVSRYAAGMPQTNISLRPGDQVPIETAIKALIIRSANDVAVVVAEYLAGSEARFAEMATRKARALGMNNTVFKNPNGLPNAAQYTNARDMAKLGIALRRDFPSYYKYFAVRQFSWRGVNYYTHNRVMTRMNGVDGIKTGFINASGFNVVSSVERGGRRLIGVVMGGGSGTWRDDRMIALLNQGYKTLADRGNRQSRTIYAANLPTPKAGATAIAAAAPAQRKPVNVPADRGIAGSASQQERVNVTGEVPFARMNADQAQEYWGIQVGAFADKEQAEQAVAQAYQVAQTALQGSKVSVIGAGVAGSTIHRARLENLSEDQAKQACRALISNNSPCFIYRTGGQSL